MKKIISIFISVTVIFAACTACGNDNDNESVDITGVWKLTLDDVTDIYTFTGNNTWTRETYGLTTTGTYSVSGKKLDICDENGKVLFSHTFSLKGDTLTINKLDYIRQ